MKLQKFLTIWIVILALIVKINTLTNTRNTTLSIGVESNNKEETKVTSISSNTQAVNIIKTNLQNSSANNLSLKQKETPAQKNNAEQVNKTSKQIKEIRKTRFPRPSGNKIIKKESMMIVPQSYLGTCHIDLASLANDFFLTTVGLSPCVGLTYYSLCADNKIFTMLAHFDSGHKSNLGIYLQNFMARIPAGCDNGKFTYHVVSTDDDLLTSLKENLQGLAQPKEEKSYGMGNVVDMAINIKNGETIQFNSKHIKTPEQDVTVFEFLNTDKNNCKLYYMGKNRMCKVDPQSILGAKFGKELQQFNNHTNIGYTYGFFPPENPSDADVCRRDDMELERKKIK